MFARPAAPLAIGALDLAALLCSRVCHDLISPVGAIINGLEVMEEDRDEETKTFALDLIKRSAAQASAKLQFCRFAFGAAGSAGAQIELGDADQFVQCGAGGAVALVVGQLAVTDATAGQHPAPSPGCR